MDMIAQKVIDKYTNSTCVQLAEAKSEKPTGEKARMEQWAIAALKADPQMRKAFIDKVAAPIANKVFAFGMIPLAGFRSNVQRNRGPAKQHTGDRREEQY